MQTYEELLASYTELAHFNPNHDPRNGWFSKSETVTLSSFKPTRAAVVASSVAAAATAYRVGKNWTKAYALSKSSGMMSETDLNGIKKKGIYKTGTAAMTIGLAVYGAVRLSEITKEINRRSEEEKSERKPTLNGN